MHNGHRLPYCSREGQPGPHAVMLTHPRDEPRLDCGSSYQAPWCGTRDSRSRFRLDQFAVGGDGGPHVPGPW
jgi:hypothetical protein